MDFTVMANAIGDTITHSVSVIGAVTEQLKKAIADGFAIYDRIKLRALNHRFDSLLNIMTSTNALKRITSDALRDFIHDYPLAMTWFFIQRDCARIAGDLDTIFNDMDNTALVRNIDFNITDDLKTALLRQSSIYLRLSTLKEPVTENERAQLENIADKLDMLLRKVGDAHRNIDNYLRKVQSDRA